MWGWGGGANLPEQMHYKGVQFNDISIMMGWVGGDNFPEKKQYVTLEVDKKLADCRQNRGDRRCTDTGRSPWIRGLACGRGKRLGKLGVEAGRGAGDTKARVQRTAHSRRLGVGGRQNL